ncbi:2Fe-2S iron-sulfur cluster-binding protein [Profundibacter sp.]|uniref:2Fe-2S iron-sulfur cluster-binding protein n=1 Tax=Profundibacter sp. TaxID=3101071 RepID=UPI003D126B95
MPTVRLEGETAGRPIRDGEVVLGALERTGATSVRVGCRKGGCGACRVKVLSGEYTTLKMSRAHVTEQEEREGFALSCRLLAKTDLILSPAFRAPKRPG